jgi:heparin binding hemagglutinin HbhA
MAKARFDIPAQIPASVARPLYAGVGVTDRVVEAVRETVADVQKRAAAVQHDVTKTVAGLDYQPQALRRQAGDTLDHLVKRGETLVDRIRRQPSTTATTDSAKTTVAKAKTTRTQATKTATATSKTAKKSVKRTASRTTKKAAKSPARSSAKATATSAKKTARSGARASTAAARKVGN